MQNFLSMFAGKDYTSLAIGKFDGIHLGHQVLLSKLSDNAATIIIDTQSTTFLTSISDRMHALPNPYVFSLETIQHLEGRDFITMLTQSLPMLNRIVVGYDFRFGYGRKYGAYDIQKMFEKEVVIVPKVCYEGNPLHSSVIRDLLQCGQIAEANAMLNRRYRIIGSVVVGQGLGRKELFPTINVEVFGYVVPADGVYVTYVNGQKAVSFLGHRLSTDGVYAIESHIIQGEALPLESSITIEFCQRIRANKHFASLKDLKAQIQHDIDYACSCDV